jgi:RsiW-degrading membrane proteinase PrsW (M82 family)
MATVVKWHCGCGKLLTAPDSAAGKKGRCPQCRAILTVPAAVPQTTAPPTNTLPPAVPRPTAQPVRAAPIAAKPAAEPDDDFKLQAPAPARPPELPRPLFDAPAVLAPRATVAPATLSEAMPVVRLRPINLPPARTSPREYLHLVLFLALIPLAIDTLWSKPAVQDIQDRLATTAEEHPEIAPKLADCLNRLSVGKADVEELFNILPDHEISGAFLPHDSHLHWLLALLSATLFFGLLLALFPSAKINRLSLAGVGLLTATVGVLLLIGFQYAAEWTQGRMFIGRSIVVIIFYIVKFIGFSYSCASDPRNGFLLSFFGYTLGVGLCEEICKAMPLLARFQQFENPSRDPRNTWQSACLWGMASGVGFGIAEGVLYSGTQYNGMSSGLIYLVRFASCVTLHAVWAGSVGITMFNRQRSLQTTANWYEYCFQVVLTIGIAMTLHGLYDTLFKKDMPVLALGVAVVSFAWLAIQIEMVRQTEPATKPMRAALT